MDNKIANKIAGNHVLTITQADEVFASLEAMERDIGNIPDWAMGLSEMYEREPSNIAIVLAGWKAIARAYRTSNIISIGAFGEPKAEDFFDLMDP